MDKRREALAQISKVAYESGVMFKELSALLSESGVPPMVVVNDIPTIVTLCGSTKFKQTYEEANLRETKAGKIVLSCGCFAHADGIVLTEEEKNLFDELHKRKIDISSEILVLNIGGYIGESTRSEIAYAIATGKKVYYWVDPE